MLIRYYGIKMAYSILQLDMKKTKQGKVSTNGKAKLLFEVDENGATRLKELYQSDPLRIFFPNTPDQDILQAALVNVSGGLVGGDKISADIQLGKNTKAVIAAQSAEKVYRSSGEDTRMEIKIKVGPGSWLEFLPQETILFQGSRLRRQIDISIEGDGSLVAGEILIFGRRGYGEYFESGLIHESWEIERDGRLLWADTLHMEKNIASTINHPACFDGAVAMATVIYAGPNAKDNLLVIQNLLIATDSDVLSSVTCINGVMIIRWLGSNALDVRNDFGAFWCAFRSKIADLPEKLPRLWNM